MADISSITLPSGNTYNLKDATARSAIAALQGGSYFLGVTSTALTDGATTNPITIDGNSVTAVNGNMVVSSDGKKEYVFYVKGTTKKWVEFGDLSTLGTLAYKSSVTLNKGASATNVLGASTTFTNASSAVSFAAHTTKKVLGKDTTFTLPSTSCQYTMATVPLKVNVSGGGASIGATAAAITGFGAHSKTSFVTGVTASTSKLVTTTVPNVTSAGSASTWAFSVSGEVLSITGANGSAPTLGTAKTVATGSLDANGGGASVATGASASGSAQAITALGTPTTANCATSLNAAPISASLSTGQAEEVPGTGEVSMIAGFQSITIPSIGLTVGTNDQVNAITALGAGTAAAQTITVGTNDRIGVAKYSDLSVSVS